jgi:hypothetical protein
MFFKGLFKGFKRLCKGRALKGFVKAFKRPLKAV